MSANRSNISQIRKYLNGELDARAMYELERRAQDDPMLMDMIKGMESGDANEHEHNLANIDQLIKQRVEKDDDRRVIPLYRYWAAAACLLIALGIGGWWLTHQTQKPLVATNIHPVLAPDKVKVQQMPLADKSVPPANKQVAATRFVPPKVTISEPAAADISPSAPSAIASDIKIDTATRIASEKKTVVKSEARELNEVSIVGYDTQTKRSVLGSSVSAVDNNRAPHDTTLNQALAGRIAGVAITKSKANADTPRTITGKVVSKDDGSPLPGVTVRINGLRTGTQTDAAGNFNIILPTKEVALNVGFVGYETQKVQVGNRDNLKIELTPVSNSLSEVVVVGYGAAKTGAVPYEAEHPLIGWADYNKYLKENATLAEGKSITVQLMFSVSGNGTVSNIQVIKGSTDELNQRAIKLIENGSKWVGSTDGKTKLVKLSIKFHKE